MGIFDLLFGKKETPSEPKKEVQETKKETTSETKAERIGLIDTLFETNRKLRQRIVELEKELAIIKKETTSEPKKEVQETKKETTSEPKKEVQETKKETTSDSKKTVKNDNGFNRIYTEDGGYQEFYKKNGSFTGEFKMYNKNGILIKHIENLVQHGDEVLVNGKQITRYHNGSLQTECCFIRGSRDGFGISYTEDGWIDQIDYYKNDEDVSWVNDENKKIMLKEIKKYMNDGINVYPVQYLGLCETLGFDPKEFKDNPNFKI